MPVTLKDIAEQTGVSPSVVSTVLSGRDNGTFVSENTRRKVLQVAEALNYTPVRSGRPRGSRRLRRQRTEQFIGVWDADYSPATSVLLQHLQTALADYALEIGAEAEDDYGFRLLTADDLPRLDALGIMGLVLLSPALLPREAAAASIPCVMIGEVDNAPREWVQVHVDSFAAGQTIADHLWGLGHRRVALLAPQSFARVTRQQFQGMQKSWAMHGGNIHSILPAPYDTVRTLGEHEQVRRTVQSLFGPEASASGHPTAIACADDSIAAVAVQTLAELDRAVPQDISLVAFHDTPRLAEALTPPLTAMRRPLPVLAAQAIAQLYTLHDGEAADPDAPRDWAFPGELIVRASTAPPR